MVALGDLAMNAGSAFTSTYIGDVLKIMQSASNQSLTIVNFDEDEDLATYLTQLRETLIDCYTSIVHGIRNDATKDLFIQYCPSIFSFL